MSYTNEGMKENLKSVTVDADEIKAIITNLKSL
jgi:hypothetical protein